MTDRVCCAVVGGGQRRIEAAVLALPFRPQSIDIAMEQEEQRILRRRADARDRAAEAGMRRPMGIALHGPEQAVLRAERQGLRLGAQPRRRRPGVEQRPAIDALHAVGPPELQRVGVAELDGAERIGDAQEFELEEVRRRPVEAPVGQRDAGIDRLKLALQIEQVGTMPRQEARRAVGLRRADVGVHVAEVGKAAQALVVQLGKRRYETVAFGRLSGCWRSCECAPSPAAIRPASCPCGLRS